MFALEKTLFEEYFRPEKKPAKPAVPAAVKAMDPKATMMMPPGPKH
jgi:hypothetical protein